MDESALDEVFAAIAERIDLDGPSGAYLFLDMTYPAGGGALPAAIRDHHNKLEDAFLALADRTTVSHGGSSVDAVMDGGAEFWRESFALSAATPAPLRPLADRAAELVRVAGFPDGHTFALRLRSPDAAGKMVERVRPITPDGGGRWRVRADRLRLRPAKKKPPAGYPDRLAYLAGWAERCHWVGGNDFYDLFSHEPDLRAFLAGLSTADRAGLIELFSEIVRRRDHLWVRDWWRRNAEADEPEQPAWADTVMWLLAVLERLRDGGLLGGGGRGGRARLIFWEDLS